MPKVTKDVEKENIDSKKVKKTSSTTKKATTKSSKTVSNKKSTSKKAVVPKKKTTSKNTTSSKKSTSKKTTSKKVSAKGTVKKVVAPDFDSLEYYDLPYRYNQTVVKILAQTPKTLFVYWDISDKDKKNFAKDFGEDFFQKTIPILKIYNKTKNYYFEVEINDFANSWYFNVNDPYCDYVVELFRKFKVQETNINTNTDYLYIATSNAIEAPNNQILLDTSNNILSYRNVKTNHTFEKDVAKLNLLHYVGKSNHSYKEFYKKFYKVEDVTYLSNPTSFFK